MGVHGLWRLIEPSGKPVPLETLENKILAVDISIWLHQAIKGFQDSKGAPLPNAHLLGIYHRVCKLLYFRVKPIFVFDGGVPSLKKQTIAKRHQQKVKNLNEANDIQTKLLKTLIKQTAVSKVISEKATASQKNTTKHENVNTKEDIFKLPELPPSEQQIDSTLDSSYSDDDYESSSSSSPSKQWDLHTIDEKSVHFRSLPADVRHEILTELKETRKQSSWGRIHELPTESGDFSSFQVKRLLKRYSVQVSLEEAEKEMGGHSLSLGELEALLKEEGVVTSSQTGKRIASNENARYLLIKDVKKAMDKAKENEEKNKTAQETLETVPEEIPDEIISESLAKTDTQLADKEFQNDLEAAIQLSLQDQPSTSKETESKTGFYLENFKDADFESESESDQETTTSRLKSAQSYMMEYSGLTPNEIAKIINGNNQKPKVPKKKKFNSQIEIIPEMIENEINIVNKKVEESIISNEIMAEKSNKVENLIQEINSNQKDNIAIEIMSDSDDSFVEVPENAQIMKNGSKQQNKIGKISNFESSDSDDSDFVEVNNEKEIKDIRPHIKSNLEIVINPNVNLQDDIFGDIFEVKTENKKPAEVKPTEHIQEPSKRIEENQENKKPDITENKGSENIPKQDETTEETQENKKAKKAEDNQVTKESKIIENKIIKETEKNVQPEKPRLTVEELNIMKTNLAAEQQQLMTERNTKERMAGNITDQMYQEAQELLELFGVPYITAPMEAEAQCAFLNEIDLTDGTITDDSDIWLFGGKTVYKNFFNHNKHVFEFRAESIEHHFKLTREQLILLALLVGSDYTLGLQGIGPVTALEILAAFPPAKNANITVLTQDELITGLSEFRRWLSEGRSVGVGRTALRSKLRNVTLSEGFPNLQVIQAYLQPKVETCRDKFTWAKPDIVGLIDFAKEKFGWTKLKSEEILKPVMKKLDDRNIQKTIKDYFATKHKLGAGLDEHKLSKRVRTAVKKMGKAADDQVEEEKPKFTRKKAPRKTKSVDSTTVDKTTKRKPPAKKDKTVNDYIPQKERDKIDALKNKLKAIEVYRKSKQGPGFLKKREKAVQEVKEDAELSESSSSE